MEKCTKVGGDNIWIDLDGDGSKDLVRLCVASSPHSDKGRLVVDTFTLTDTGGSVQTTKPEPASRWHVIGSPRNKYYSYFKTPLKINGLLYDPGCFDSSSNVSCGVRKFNIRLHTSDIVNPLMKREQPSVDTITGFSISAVRFKYRATMDMSIEQASEMVEQDLVLGATRVIVTCAKNFICTASQPDVYGLPRD